MVTIMSVSDLKRVEQYVVDLFRPQEYNGSKYGAFKVGWFQTCRRDKPADNRLYWNVPTRGDDYGDLSATVSAYVDADSYVEKRVMLQLIKCLKMPHVGYIVAFVQVDPSSKSHLFDYPGPEMSLYFNKDAECFVFCLDVPAVDNAVYPGFMRVYIRE